MQVLIRNLGPYEHGPFGAGHFPSGPVETGNQGVATLSVSIVDFPDTLLVAFQGDDRGNLDGLEDPVIQVALDSPQGTDDFRITNTIANPPAGHGVAFGHGEEFNSHFLGPLGLQETGCLVAVEGQIGIGEIVNDHDIVFFGPIHNLFKKLQIHDFRGRVVRVAQDQNLGLGPGLTGGLHQVVEKVLVGTGRYAPHIPA